MKMEYLKMCHCCGDSVDLELDLEDEKLELDGLVELIELLLELSPELKGEEDVMVGEGLLRECLPEVVLELGFDADIDSTDTDGVAEEELDLFDNSLELKEPFEAELFRPDEGVGELEGFEEDERLEFPVTMGEEDVAGDDLDFEAKTPELDR